MAIMSVLYSIRQKAAANFIMTTVGISTNEGPAFTESKSINLSLSCLGNTHHTNYCNPKETYCLVFTLVLPLNNQLSNSMSKRAKANNF